MNLSRRSFLRAEGAMLALPFLPSLAAADGLAPESAQPRKKLAIVYLPNGIVRRCFFPGDAVPEDPVTGSAHCTLVPYWAARLQKNRLRAFQASARGGELACELVGDRVRMGGWAVKVIEGWLTL